ncbi:MAG: hypothetical protein G01um10147_567 [Microgenomates group bacterium Gr01-1014_7]|nr:MAG: hypothetical protein G01um10147_567 [Microgenomates group bacterium Gr01-1014_7]
MFTQKLYKNGNSVVVSIPKEYLKKYNLRDGTEVVVEDKDGIVVTSKKKNTAFIDSRFARMVDEFINDHEDVLAKLAKR